MDDYIKRENALVTIKELVIDHPLDSDRYLLRKYLDAAEKIPAADVVEVVRCKDCKHCGTPLSEAERKKAVSNPCSDLVCDMWMSDGFTPGDYCSQGERRNDDV